MTASYGYDAFNRRISKTVNGTTEYFVYDNEDIIEDRSSTGTLTADYVHGSRIDEVLSMTRSGNTYYYHHDGLGSVTEITNNSGTLIENYTYDVYGQPSVITSSIGNRYRFTGREFDEETGLYHYRARAYSPTTGRFLQRDPIDMIEVVNLYAYVENDPINWFDANGEYKENTQNKQEKNRNKHEEANSRRQKEQAKSDKKKAGGKRDKNSKRNKPEKNKRRNKYRPEGEGKNADPPTIDIVPITPTIPTLPAPTFCPPTHFH